MSLSTDGLDDLPEYSVVKDKDGELWLKVDGYWRLAVTSDPGREVRTVDLVYYEPINIVHEATTS